MADYLDLSASTLEELRTARAAAESHGRGGSWDEDGAFVVPLTGSSGTWSKAYVWREQPPEQIHADSMGGPAFGVVHAELRDGWYIRRSGQR